MKLACTFLTFTALAGNALAVYCHSGYTYCGWALFNNGFSKDSLVDAACYGSNNCDISDAKILNSMFYCSNVQNPYMITGCGGDGSCAGPTAHCVF
ncbi:hypothetical protein K432DRAFT_385917 [Lepidopterella palustris CBS 459.81]|uniref:Uncharacterized protein n=1 Tax=Lepidopterella palustris CBS 459.81 TaxID=1314670 RepID=A0A8E2JAV0_9PEZI|nr:hypothetical protein K432DRAFT_385917 [Lepidopterella palustris CBS 459.81]